MEDKIKKDYIDLKTNIVKAGIIRASFPIIVTAGLFGIAMTEHCQGEYQSVTEQQLESQTCSEDRCYINVNGTQQELYFKLNK